MQYTPEQKRKFDRLNAVLKDGIVAVLKDIDNLEEKINKIVAKVEKRLDETLLEVDEKLPNLAVILDKIKGKDADPLDVANSLRNDPLFIEIIKPDNGKDYILTEADKMEIASLITPPVKVIEKHETVIVKEQPIITQEVKEVAKYKTPEEERDDLESLPIGKRLHVDFIDGIKELLDELVKRYNKKGNSSITVGGSFNGGRIVRSYDLSPLLDGVLKTFALPANWRVISVHSSSAPGSLRETVDYTYTPQSITFTSEINATSTLAAGQTITVVYSE